MGGEMNNLETIERLLEYLSIVTLTAETRGKREYQLAEYKKAYALLLDTRPIWNDSFEIKNASLFAHNNLRRLTDQFVETELMREATRIIDAADLIR
jgi:hypothetical protein